MRELVAELKHLRLHGMACAWSELLEQGGNASVDSSRWLLEHLLASGECRSRDALGALPDDHGQVPGAP